MNNDFAITIPFKQLLPDFASFQDFIDEFTSLSKTDVSHILFYRLIFNKYYNSNINYDTAEAFYRHFAIDYENVFAQMKMRQDLFTRSYAVSPNEINVINTSITSQSLNDNTTLTNPLDNLTSYVNFQTGNKTRVNELFAYVKAIDALTDRFFNEYLDNFNKHFMQVLETPIIFYGGNE